MKDLGWYWHRLRAMSPAELALHVRKKLRQRMDSRRLPDWTGALLRPFDSFPVLPPPDQAPGALRDALAREAGEIAAGRWRAFGHLDLQVDTPPRWHTDYLVGKDLATRASAFGLNHRALPDGADVKLVWELSRWYPLVRLAQAAHVLGDAASAQLCVAWLEDWGRENPPYRGWNWTSALEVGMRLIQFTWIDALLGSAAAADPALEARLAGLRQSILPPHASFAWRYRSFGSSANNHLLGELVGLILATTRWPELARWGAPIPLLQQVWEREVLSQFAVDGGNCEQALNYQLFSFEFCWQARLALRAVGRSLSDPVEDRLTRAGRFFWNVQVSADCWDYGDSDSAYVTPLFASDRSVVAEWRAWMEGGTQGETLRYWIGKPPALRASASSAALVPEELKTVGDWGLYPDTGIAVHASGLWRLRWDLSPLGYLKTAAHGHLDALHLSVWLKGVAFVVDPGTGAYYADRELRNWLASRAAHNGPSPTGVDEYPRRLGPFLWQSHHAVPKAVAEGDGTLGTLELPGRRLRRRVTRLQDGSGWQVEDECFDGNGARKPFMVRWQFPPGTVVRALGEREFVLSRSGVEMRMVVNDEWNSVELPGVGAAGGESGVKGPAGAVSCAFRKRECGPFLLLRARPDGDGSCAFVSTFLG